MQQFCAPGNWGSVCNKNWECVMDAGQAPMQQSPAHVLTFDACAPALQPDVAAGLPLWRHVPRHDCRLGRAAAGVWLCASVAACPACVRQRARGTALWQPWCTATVSSSCAVPRRASVMGRAACTPWCEASTTSHNITQHNTQVVVSRRRPRLPPDTPPGWAALTKQVRNHLINAHI